MKNKCNHFDEQKEIYNKRYLENYRDKLNGYEFARWKAINHFIGKTLKLNNVNSVLDYGSGSGLHIDLWKNLFPSSKLYFCDISSIALKKLTRKHPEYIDRCLEVKENATSLKNEYFDVIVSVEVMEHVKNLNDYLSDIYRVLKPGGVYIWTTPCANKFSVEHIYNVLTNNIEKTVEGFRRWKWEDPTHLRRMKSNEIDRKLRDIGFANIRFRFRAHLFSYICTRLFKGRLKKVGEKMMFLDYCLFRKFNNGSSMIGYAKKPDKRQRW